MDPLKFQSLPWWYWIPTGADFLLRVALEDSVMAVTVKIEIFKE